MTQPAIAPATPTPAAAPAPAPAEAPAKPYVSAGQPKPPENAKPEKVRVRSHERALRVKEKLDAAAPAESPESTDEGEAETEAAPVKAASPKEPDAAEKNRSERQARIAAAREKERAQDQERAQRSQHTRKARAADSELETLRKRVAELEPNEAVFKDEETLLSAAEKRGMTAEKLVQWMRTRLNDPNAVAQRQAQTVEEKLQAKLDAMQARIDKDASDRRAEQRQAREERESIDKAHRFFGQAKDASSTHPLTAALQSRHGDAGLLAFANTFVAPHLAEGYSLQELHDLTEQFLDEVQVGTGQLGTPAGASHPAKNGAAAKPTTTTLSNGVASERVSATEEVPWARLPRRERTQRLKDRLDRD